jgi:hypothetical protein
MTSIFPKMLSLSSPGQEPGSKWTQLKCITEYDHENLNLGNINVFSVQDPSQLKMLFYVIL